VEFSTLVKEDDVPYNFSTSAITGLRGDTYYHYRAYAYNGVGQPAYGDPLTLLTPPIFTLESQSDKVGARVEGSSAYFVIGEKGYLLGGDNGPNYTNNLWSYYPVLNPEKWWEYTAYTAGNMKWVSVAVIDTKVYVLGGLGTGFIEKDDFYVYNTNDNVWVSKTTGPPPAYSRVGFSLYNEIVYVGGMKDTAKNEVWGYNVVSDTWTQKPDFPVNQFGGIAFNINNTVYAGLGKNTTGDGNKQLWKSNGSLSAWIPESFGSILNGNILAGTVFKDKIYVIDKISNTQYAIFEYDPATQEWKRKSDLPNKYTSWDISFMFSLQNRIFIGFAEGNKVVSYNPLWDN
jgi:N-acetylneuraminic acid mutarotase